MKSLYEGDAEGVLGQNHADFYEVLEAESESEPRVQLRARAVKQHYWRNSKSRANGSFAGRPGSVGVGFFLNSGKVGEWYESRKFWSKLIENLATIQQNENSDKFNLKFCKNL